LQRARENDIDDVVILDADEDTVTSQYTDVQLLPLDVVSLPMTM